jgi:hypothetical protein
MRLVVVTIATIWGIAALAAFATTSDRSLDAKLTAAYILLWPVFGVMLLLSEPVPLGLAVPMVFGFIPWLMAGPHLWAVVKDPAQTRQDEVIGIPRVYWVWGGLGAILLGIVFN